MTRATRSSLPLSARFSALVLTLALVPAAGCFGDDRPAQPDRTRTAPAPRTHVAEQRPRPEVLSLTELEINASRCLQAHDDAESAKALKGKPSLDSDELDALVARDYGITEDDLRAAWDVWIETHSFEDGETVAEACKPKRKPKP